MNKLFFLLLSCIVAQGSVNAMEQFSLHEAVKQGDLEHVQALLNDGADVNLQNDNGCTPLFLAAFHGEEAIVELLLDRGANVNLRGRPFGWTPLHFAVFHGREAIVERLLSRGANINLQGDDGNTPLFLAAMSYKQAIVELLLAKGANINLQNNDGQTPLHGAFCHPYDETNVRLLLEKGADVNLKSNYGWTPLLLAIHHGWQGVERIIQRIQQAEQKAQEVTSTLEIALFDQSDDNQSPLAILPGDGGQPLLLREIIELSREAILQQAREQQRQ